MRLSSCVTRLWRLACGPGCRRGGAAASCAARPISLVFWASRSVIRRRGTDDIGVLFGVALQQAVEVALLGLDATVDLGRGHLDRGLLEQAPGDDVARLRLLGRQLRLAESRACSASRNCRRASSSCRLSAAMRDAASLPSGDCMSRLRSRNSFSRDSASSSLASKLRICSSRKTLGRVGVLARGSQTGLDEDRHQGLDHALGLLLIACPCRSA